MRRTAALNQRDDEPDDRNCESVNRERIDQDVNVFGLTEILAKSREHDR